MTVTYKGERPESLYGRDLFWYDSGDFVYVTFLNRTNHRRSPDFAPVGAGDDSREAFADFKELLEIEFRKGTYKGVVG